MEINLEIEDREQSFINKFLKDKVSPVELDEVVYQVAMLKTENRRKNRVKLYDPESEYSLGDLIFKEYQGKLPVGAKKYIDMDRGVVMKVVDVRNRFGLEEVKLEYEGTTDFRKYTQYLKRQKIELLLPHKQDDPPAKTEYLADDEDPRTKQAPLVDKELSQLKKKIVSCLNRGSDIILIQEKVLLKKNLKKIDKDVFTKIREFLNTSKMSESTEFFVENFIKVDPDSEEFFPYCFALNYVMENDYKIDFQKTNTSGWGKWNLISVIYYMKKDSLIGQENPLLYKATFADKKNMVQKRRKFEEKLLSEGKTRYFLTQREVTCGALKLRSGTYQFGESIELSVIDASTKKQHTLYYYTDNQLIMGFKEVFDSYKILQGTPISFEQLDDELFQFHVRVTKRGTVADRIEYNPESRTFTALDEKVASYCFVNKSLFLESEVFNFIHEHIDEFRNVESLNQLVHKVFLNFGIKEKNYEIHVLRLYHILDLIFPISLKIVEEVLLSNLEFVPSEKITGVFYLDSAVLGGIEEEESVRRQEIVVESQKEVDVTVQAKMDEELKQKEEIRLKREERRKKREEEMWLKESLQRERDKRSELETRRKPRAAAGAASPGRPSATKPGAHKPAKEFAGRGKAFPDDFEKIVATAESAGKKSPTRRAKKKEDIEKTPKTQKRIDKDIVEEKIDLEDIKSDIKFEELKEQVLSQKKQELKKKKETKVAFKDTGDGFGGILASKLDEVVKKDKDEDKDKKKKTKKKSDEDS